MRHNRLGIPLRGLLFAVLVLSSAVGNQTQAGITYDAVNDFSLASNPNGAWSYGTLSSLSGGTFTAFNLSGSNIDYAGEQIWSNGKSVPINASVSKNASASTADFLTIIQPTDVLRLDGQNNIDDVRWIAPNAGLYSLSGFFQRIDVGNLPVSVNVLLNGTALFTANNFATFNSVQDFSFASLNLAAGAVLDFTESAPQFNNDSTGLSATITNLSSVPEPSSITMVLIGLAAALARLIRRYFRKSSGLAAPMI